MGVHKHNRYYFTKHFQVLSMVSTYTEIDLWFKYNYIPNSSLFIIIYFYAHKVNF